MYKIKPPANMPKICSIAVGGCVRDLSRLVSPAHAHVYEDDFYKGYVCVRKRWDIGKIKGSKCVEPSLTLKHEYTHFFVHTNATGNGNYVHGWDFINKMRELWGRVDSATLKTQIFHEEGRL